jgi:hypothetical protein
LIESREKRNSNQAEKKNHKRRKDESTYHARPRARSSLEGKVERDSEQAQQSQHGEAADQEGNTAKQAILAWV